MIISCASTQTSPDLASKSHSAFASPLWFRNRDILLNFSVLHKLNIKNQKFIQKFEIKTKLKEIGSLIHLNTFSALAEKCGVYLNHHWKILIHNTTIYNRYRVFKTLLYVWMSHIPLKLFSTLFSNNYEFSKRSLKNFVLPSFMKKASILKKFFEAKETPNDSTKTQGLHLTYACSQKLKSLNRL